MMNQELRTPATPSAANVAEAPPLACDAGDWGVLAISGADATAFLQGQLSSDVKGLGPGTGQWTSYNSPKGRMLANGFLWRMPDGNGYRLALSADIAEPIRKRLSMFVMRSKVAIADLSPTHARIGVAGPSAIRAIAAVLGDAPGAGQAIERDGASLVALPDGRVLIVVDVAGAGALRARLATTTLAGDATAWRRANVEAGTALVTASTQDALLPQAANVDLLGGVVLGRDKGCFPGQEVIKRTQSLGHLKERLYAFHATGAVPRPGARLYGATFGDQSCGIVVDAAGMPEGGALLLATVQIRAAEADVLHLDAPDGPVLAPRSLPYAVPAPTPPRRTGNVGG